MTVEELMRRPYKVVFTYDAGSEDGGWFAAVAELPGCMSEGDTLAEAAANIQDAMRVWFGWMLDNGEPIPDPIEIEYPPLPVSGESIGRPRFVEPSPQEPVDRSRAPRRGGMASTSGTREFAHR